MNDWNIWPQFNIKFGMTWSEASKIIPEIIKNQEFPTHEKETLILMYNQIKKTLDFSNMISRKAKLLISLMVFVLLLSMVALPFGVELNRLELYGEILISIVGLLAGITIITFAYFLTNIMNDLRER